MGDGAGAHANCLPLDQETLGKNILEEAPYLEGVGPPCTSGIPTPSRLACEILMKQQRGRRDTVNKGSSTSSNVAGVGSGGDDTSLGKICNGCLILKKKIVLRIYSFFYS